MIAGSKRFTNPSRYEFSLAVYSSFDGGFSWNEYESLELQPDWTGTSDPALAWDGFKDGNAYLVALPFGPDTDEKPLKGMAAYTSSDGGMRWSSPKMIHESEENELDDKQWAAGDVNPTSPYYGNVYAVWDGIGESSVKLQFARTTDRGKTWKGISNKPSGSALPNIDDSESPEISVAADGTVYIVWLGEDDKEKKPAIKFVKSNDGGNSFSNPMIVARNITPLDSPPLPQSSGGPILPNGSHKYAQRSHFENATFRVVTVPTSCTGPENNITFAWADYREGVSRIYYRHSSNGGDNWDGPSSGQPLLDDDSVISQKDQHDFHPQLISTPGGQIGCAFYEFGHKGHTKSQSYLIDVIFAISTDNGKTFSQRTTVTEYPWDPAVDAPNSGGDPEVTFIGEYFGLDASRLGFFPLWTDTRTGTQEIFIARINEI